MEMEMEKRRRAMEVEEGRRRQRQNRQVLTEFRTPQHPSLGTNNWGGASPMLARNIPKEALDQRYQRLCTVRNRDEIYPVQGNENDDCSSFLDDGSLDHDQYSPRSSRFRGTAFLLKLVRPKKKKKKKKENKGQLGNAEGKKKRKYWNLPRWDPKTRWPQGWC